jgi:hypothetical protein
MTGYVTVASKLPGGLWLRNFAFKDMTIHHPNGDSHTEKQAFEIEGSRVKINGYSVSFRKQAPYEIDHGYALTFNVDADIWDAWLAVNKNSDMVKNRVIFAMPKLEDVRSEVKKMEKVKSGMEQLQPEGDPRAPRQVFKDDRRQIG